MTVANTLMEDVTQGGDITPLNRSHNRGQTMHRVNAVRLQKKISLGDVSKSTGKSILELSRQESETTNLQLSELRVWAEALDVSVTDLLVDSGDGLSLFQLNRPELMSLVRHAQEILGHSNSASIHRLANNLIQDINELLPHLANE